MKVARGTCEGAGRETDSRLRGVGSGNPDATSTTWSMFGRGNRPASLYARIDRSGQHAGRDGAHSFHITQAHSPMFGAESATSVALRRVLPARWVFSAVAATVLTWSLVATPIAADVRRMFAANTAFFRLMQGFLAPGMFVGITGLGVVMVRALRERRRTIGVLRALGFRARTIERSFLVESGFIAVEGVLLGSVLGVLTTWLMYQESAAFDGIRSGLPDRVAHHRRARSGDPRRVGARDRGAGAAGREGATRPGRPRRGLSAQGARSSAAPRNPSVR